MARKVNLFSKRQQAFHLRKKKMIRDSIIEKYGSVEAYKKELSERLK